MIASVSRKDRELNDAIEVLDQVLAANQNDIRSAWDSLSSDELNFIDEEMGKVLDLRYFLENYYCIRTENGITKTLYPFWTHQEILYEAIQQEWDENGQCLIIVLKPRQAGITVWVSASMFHRTITVPNVYTMTVAQNGKTSTHIFKMMYYAYNMLPWWMRPEIAFKQEGEYIEFQRTDEDERITSPGLGSAIRIEDAQIATGAAIGRTVRCFHGSEVSRWPNADMFTADIEPSMNATDEYGIMESTAFGREGLYYDHWRGSVDGDTGWRSLFIPVYRVRKYSLPPKGEFIKTAEETIFTERVKREEHFDIPDSFWNWRRRRVRASIRTTGAPWAHFESYPITPEEAFQSSGICAFDRSALMEQRNKNVCKPIFVGEVRLGDIHGTFVNTDQIREVGEDEILPRRKGEMKNDKLFLRKDRLWIWELPESREVYYVSADVGLGVPDGDYSVAEVFRCGIGKDPDVQVAEWWGHCAPQEFAHIIAALGYWYKGNGTASEIAVEYQGPGRTTGDKLRDEVDYPNLYRDRRKDRIQNQLMNNLHWETNARTRDLIISEMNEALLTGTVVIRSETLIDEMFDFGTMDSGGGSRSVRYQGQGNHDDGVMAAQIGLYCLRETNREAKTLGLEYRPDQSSGNINIYGVFDNLMRQRGQYNNEAEAMQQLKDRPGWIVQKILVCKANTLYSPIYDASGAQHDLRYRFGMRSEQILPDVVSAYRAATEEGGVGYDEEW